MESSQSSQHGRTYIKIIYVKNQELDFHSEKMEPTRKSQESQFQIQKHGYKFCAKTMSLCVTRSIVDKYSDKLLHGNYDHIPDTDQFHFQDYDKINKSGDIEYMKKMNQHINSAKQGIH